MPETTVSGILTRTGLGRLGRMGLEPARRYERSRPGELVHVDVKKLGRIVRGVGNRVTGGSSHYTPRLTDRRVAAGARRDGSSSTSASTTLPARLRRGPGRRAGDHRGGLSASRGALLRAPRGRGRARAHRQRLRLPLGGPRDRVPDARDPPPARPPASTADQRQGRALHPARGSSSSRRTRRSARCSAAGLTARSIAAPRSGPPPSRAGYGATTSGVHTVPSAARRPQPA